MFNMKNLFFLSIFLLHAALLSAQQTPLFSLYRDSWAVLNPAAISNNYLLNNRTMTLSGTWRTQWWGLAESPRTQALNWEWVDEDRNSVWGGHALNDQTGKIGQTGVYGRYAYRLRMGRRMAHSLTIGLQGGAVQYRARLSEIEFPDPRTAPQTDQRVIRPDFGAGVFYHRADRWYAGLSVPQTFGFQTVYATEAGDVRLRRVPHIFAVAGGYWSASWLGNETSFIEPSVWLKYAPNAPLNLDLNARAQVSELVWAGAGLSLGLGERLGAALHFEAGLFFGEQVQLLNSQLKLGFSFDLPVTQGLAANFGASGEVNVVYSWR